MLEAMNNRTVSLILEDDYNSFTAVGKSDSKLAQGALTGANLVKQSAQDLVRQYLPASRLLTTTGLGSYAAKGANFITGGFLDLKSVYNISVRHEASVAVETGLFTNFMQPWSIKPRAIEIRGTTYLGAYTFLSSKDREGERLIGLYKSTLNDFSGNFGQAGSRKRVVLLLRGYPPGSRNFSGYITSLVFSETVENANLVDYTLSFIGNDLESAAQADGANRASELR